MKLYEINEQIRACLDTADFETGEIPAESIEALESLHMDLEAKALATARYIRELEALAYAAKTEESRIHTQRVSIERRAERVRLYLADQVREHIPHGEKMTDGTLSLSWRKSTALQVTGHVDEQWCRVKYEPDKTRIREAIEAGETVENCQVVENQNLQIR